MKIAMTKDHQMGYARMTNPSEHEPQLYQQHSSLPFIKMGRAAPVIPKLSPTQTHLSPLSSVTVRLKVIVKHGTSCCKVDALSSAAG